VCVASILGGGAIVFFARFGEWDASDVDVAAFVVLALAMVVPVVVWTASEVKRLADGKAMAEADLADSRRRYRHLADAVPPIVFTTAPDGRVTFSSRRWHLYVGLDFPDAIPLLDPRFIHPDELVDTMSSWKGCLANGATFEGTRRLKDVTGHYRWHNLRAVPDRDESGRIVAWIGTAEDVDEQRQASFRRDRFLAMLAHELRNPLAPIVSGLQVIERRTRHDSELSACCSAIARQAHHLTRMVDDLLDVSRGSYGKVTLRKRPVKVSDVIARAVDSTRRMFDERKHRLELLVPKEAPWIDGDEVRLTQVVANLLDNAAKFTPEGGHVVVEAIDHSDTVDIAVTDSGIGIVPESLAHVFEPFSQVGDSFEQPTSGIGIGLNLVQTLVHLHGGTVTAESGGPGTGSRFTVRLPALAQATTTEAIPLAKSEGTGVGIRVLLVDDNTDASFTLATLLRLEGHDVAVAREGTQALKLAAEFKPHVVLLDIGLPGMDGYEVARRLRSEPSTSSTVIIAVTGYSHAEARAQSKSAGFDQHMVKPIDPSALMRCIATLRAGVRAGGTDAVARRMLRE
jgi:PAS domain S-box-containing protein